MIPLPYLYYKYEARTSSKAYHKNCKDRETTCLYQGQGKHNKGLDSIARQTQDQGKAIVFSSVIMNKYTSELANKFDRGKAGQRVWYTCRQSMEVNKPGREQARRRDWQACSQSVEANKSGRGQVEAGQRVNRRWSVTRSLEGFSKQKGWDAVHGGEQDKLATKKVNTGTKYPHRHTAGKGYQGGATVLGSIRILDLLHLS